MTIPVAPPAPWIADFCNAYTPFLFSAGKLTLFAGIVLGIALAIAAIIVALRKKPAGGGANLAPAAPSAVLDAVKGFLQALSGAPTWLALFGGGILLLWLAGNSVPDICKPPVRQAPQEQGRSGAEPAPKAPAEQPRR